MLTKYLTAGLGVALLGALAFGAIQTSRVGTVKAEKRALEIEYGDLLESTIGKDTTIERLETAVAALRLAAQADQDRLRVAATAIVSYRDILAARDAQLDDLSRGDYDKPDCAALLAMDIAAVCPGVARSLRERAEGRLPGPND